MAESPAMSHDVPDDTAAAPEPQEATPRPRRSPQRSTLLDDVANDLALWIDDTANKIALAFAPGRAPFAADLTEDQKLDYYTRALFNPDGSPNVSGRNREVTRLGVEGFGAVYKAVVAAHPELKPPPEPTVAQVMQAPPVPVPMASGGIVTEPTVALIGEAGPEAVVPLSDQSNNSGVVEQIPDFAQVAAEAARLGNWVPAIKYFNEYAPRLGTAAANMAGGTLHLGPDLLPYGFYDQYLKQSGLDWRGPQQIV